MKTYSLQMSRKIGNTVIPYKRLVIEIKLEKEIITYIKAGYVIESIQEVNQLFSYFSILYKQKRRGNKYRAFSVYFNPIIFKGIVLLLSVCPDMVLKPDEKVILFALIAARLKPA